MNLHYQTALLESVGWDDQKLSDLLSFMDSFFAEKSSQKIQKGDIDVFFSQIEENWGMSAKQVVNSIFSTESFYLNLHTTGVEDVN